MAKANSGVPRRCCLRQKLIELLNEDLSREYQAIIAYVVYSQVLKGAQYMKIAEELEVHAGEELSAHALIISKQIDYLGGMPTVKAKPVKVRKKRRTCCGLIWKTKTKRLRNYRERVRQCEASVNMPWPKTSQDSRAGTGASERSGDRAGR